MLWFCNLGVQLVIILHFCQLCDAGACSSILLRHRTLFHTFHAWLMAATPLQTLLAGACCAAVLALCCTPNIGAQSTPPFSRATNAADGLTMQATEKIQQELAARIQAPRRVAASQAATFVENKGQWQGSALGTPRFLANLHRSGMAVWITDEGFVYDFFEPEQPLHAPDSIISPIDRRKWVANEVRRRASTHSTQARMLQLLSWQ